MDEFRAGDPVDIITGDYNGYAGYYAGYVAAFGVHMIRIPLLSGTALFGCRTGEFRHSEDL